MSDLVELAKQLFRNNTVGYIIGYTQDRFGRTKPFIARTEADAERLMFNNYSVHNLATYLTRLEPPKDSKVGIVAKGCDIRAIIGLMQENQIKRDQVFIIGANCSGVVEDINKDFNKENTQIKCKYCDLKEPRNADAIFGSSNAFDSPDDYQQALMEKIDAMSANEKLEFWMSEFEKCIKCYACRQVCPMCYCEQCIAEKNQPQWIESSATPTGNFAWNMIKAFHMAGRCVGCHECERVCPMDIPLTLLTRKMGMTAGKEFSYKHGVACDQPTLVGTYNLTDNQDFIK